MEKHIHEFVRVLNNKKEYMWKCNDPTCFVITPRHIAKGKLSICSKCHINTLILDSENLQYANPKCDECAVHAGARRRRALKQNLSKLLLDTFGDTNEPLNARRITENTNGFE